MNRVLTAAAIVLLVVGGWFLAKGNFTSDTDTPVIDLEASGRDLAESTPAAKTGEKPTEKEIVFGFDLRASPEEDARQYLPFLKYLEKETGYNFRLRFTPKDGQLANDLGTGVVDIAAVGAISYLKSTMKHGAIPLARGLNNQNKGSYQSLIIVRPNSKIKSLQDLRGKEMAFGSTDSTQGHIIPRIVLNKAGLNLNDLDGYNYTGSHQNCANAVISGKADACGIQDTLGEILAKQGKVRILHRSGDFPSSGIATNKNLPPDVIETIRRALVEFDPTGKHKQGLYNWERTEMPNGFAPASEQDYESFRKQLLALKLIG